MSRFKLEKLAISHANGMVPRLTASPTSLSRRLPVFTLQRALPVWLLSSTILGLLGNYLGGRATTLSLILISPLPWIVVAFVSRILLLAARIPRLAWMAQWMESGSFYSRDTGGRNYEMRALGALVGLGTVSKAASSGALRWEVYIALETAAIVSSTIVFLTMLPNLPLSTSLYPPPCFTGFSIATTLLSILSTASFFGVLREYHNDDEGGLGEATSWLVPRNTLVCVATLVCGSVVAPSDSSDLAAALVLGSGLVVWQRGIFGGFPAEGISARDEKRPRAASSPLKSHFSPSTRRQVSPKSPTSPSPFFKFPRRVPYIYLLAFAPLVLSQISRLLPSIDFSPAVPMYWSNRLGIYIRYQQPFYAPPTLDVIFSHHSEPVDLFQEFVDGLRDRSIIPRHRTRMIVYSKANDSVVEGLKAVKGIDEIVQLPNIGREGETYLTHILSRYNASLSNDPKETALPLADFTMFLQDHPAWNWVMEPRLDFFDAARTGYLSLGEYPTLFKTFLAHQMASGGARSIRKK
ncbi:hypothetical protein P7C70_g2651, partial [Phenoliferia sp. Uapishka_3]